MSTTAQFAASAPHCDRFMGRYALTLAPAFADASGITPGMRVLDVGCGPGGLTSELSRRTGAENVAGIDPSPRFVAACLDRHPAADVREGMAELLPWADGEFDATLSSLRAADPEPAPRSRRSARLLGSPRIRRESGVVGMRRYLIALSAGAALMALSGAAAQTAMATGSGGVPAPGTGVLAKPLTGTPHFSVTDSNPVEQVRQLVQCGGTMYAVGSFSKILQGSSTFARENIFSFSATPPFTVGSWAPDVNGTVNSIALNSNCSDAYIGGSFTSVNGTAVKNIAEIDTNTGAVVTSFAHNASAQVETLAVVHGHLLVGGYYKSINGSSANPYMTSLSPTTGKDDGFVHLNISGHYQYSGVSSNPTRIYNQELSHRGTLDLVMGDFTSVGGKNRQQIFMLNVGGSSATVTGWTSPAFAGHCAVQEPFYVQAASWSPDDSAVYIATTGRYAYNRPPNSFPLTGLCDAAAAFPATQSSVQPSWINYTGCDSLFSTAADASTAYFAGHERWSMNPNGCNYQGPGAYTATGLEGLSPTTGALYLNSNKKAPSGYYERSRGNGADDMLVTSAGLWIASDNFGNSQTCGFQSGLSGICFLPYGG